MSILFFQFSIYLKTEYRIYIEYKKYALSQMNLTKIVSNLKKNHNRQILLKRKINTFYENYFTGNISLKYLIRIICFLLENKYL